MQADLSWILFRQSPRANQIHQCRPIRVKPLDLFAPEMPIGTLLLRCRRPQFLRQLLFKFRWNRKGDLDCKHLRGGLDPDVCCELWFGQLVTIATLPLGFLSIVLERYSGGLFWSYVGIGLLDPKSRQGGAVDED